MARRILRRPRSNNKRTIETLRWSGDTFAFLAQTAGSSALNFISAATETDTLMRMRGEIVAWIDAASIPPLLVDCSIGAWVAPQGQGTTIVINPDDDDESPWFFYERFTLGYEEMVTDVIDVPGLTIFRKTIDLKSMRIFRPNQEAQLVFSNVTLAGASAVNCVFSVRGLFGTT